MNIKMFAMIASLTLAGTSAFAQDGEALSTTVNFGDLNLTSAAGRAQLNDRMQTAVSAVCPADRFQGLGGVVPLKQCLETARVSVEATVNLAIAQAAARPMEMADARTAH